MNNIWGKHLVMHEEKKVYFYFEAGYPTMMGIPTWMKNFPDDYEAIIASKELWKKLNDNMTE